MNKNTLTVINGLAVQTGWIKCQRVQQDRQLKLSKKRCFALAALIPQYNFDSMVLVFVFIFLSACTTQSTSIKSGISSSPMQIPVDIMSIPDAVPRYEKRTRAGNPIEYMISGNRYKVLAESSGYKDRGVASWYGNEFHGRKTSNGEVYDMYAMTAAHKTLPIPSYVRVTNLKNQRSVIVRINDRGPFHGNRIIDLSYTAAVKLGIQKSGTGDVEVIGIEPGATKTDVKKAVQESIKKEKFPLHLQMGAFNKWENAKYLEQKLISGQIRKSTIQVIYNKEENLYKVQVGPLYSTHQTVEMNKKLIGLGLSSVQRAVGNN